MLHHAGSSAGHVNGRSTSRPRWHRQDGDHQRHGALSGKVRCRLQLLRPDGLQRAWPHLQRLDARSPLHCLVVVFVVIVDHAFHLYPFTDLSDTANNATGPLNVSHQCVRPVSCLSSITPPPPLLLPLPMPLNFTEIYRQHTQLTGHLMSSCKPFECELLEL